MQVIKRIKAYFCHVIKMIFSNIPRLILSVCGLFVGMFILTIGLLLMNSYYDECMGKASQFADNVIELQLEGDEDIIADFVEKFNYDNNITRKMISPDSRTIYVKKYTNGEYCYLETKIAGTSGMADNTILAEFSNTMYIPYETEVMYGRLINDKDLADAKNVIVIDDFTSKLLFGEENSVGRMVELDVTAEGMAIISGRENDVQTGKTEFEVIGVCSNKRITQNNENRLRKFKKNGTETLILETMAYIPMSVYAMMYDEGENYFTVNCGDSRNYNTVLSYIEDYKSVHETDFYIFNVITEDDAVQSLENELKPLKILMWVILIFLLVLSGINSMNTMFFSIKERMGEIGIKKSLGAGKGTIILQFMLEGIIMALMAGIIAIAAGMLVGSALAESIQKIMYISFTVTYSAKTVYIPLITAGIYGILFSFLPSRYGAGIKVTDALKFE